MQLTKGQEVLVKVLIESSNTWMYYAWLESVVTDVNGKHGQCVWVRCADGYTRCIQGDEFTTCRVSEWRPLHKEPTVDMVAATNALDQEVARLEAENEQLRTENDRWGRRIKFLESTIATIRQLVR